MSKRKLLTNEELAAFCGQFSILNHAAITPLESIRILLSDTTDPGSQALLKDLYESISNGDSLYEAMKKTEVFPNYVLNTIHLGEEAGNTDIILKDLGEYYEHEVQVKESIKSAITYPLLMIFMMIIVIMVLVGKVLPIFSQVFEQLGTEMSGFAGSLLRMSSSLSKYSFAIVIFIVLVMLLYFFINNTAFGHRVSRKFLEKFFLTKSYCRDVAIGRFASGMALIMGAGLDTYRGLDMVSELVEHKETEDKIKVLRESIMQHENFPDALKEAKFFSNLNTRLVDVGFRSGNPDRVLKKIADEYSNKSEKRLNDVISVIEPTLVIVLSVIVGLILLSVILPLMGIMSTIG